MHGMRYTILLLTLFLSLLPTVAARGEGAPAAGVEAALVRSPVLLRHHRGYLAFLGQQPELARVEQEYWHHLAAHPVFARDALAVESALQQSPHARGAFDAFYDQLAADGNLLHALEAFLGAERSLLDGLGAAQEVGANPLAWLSILGEGAESAAVPGALMARVAAAPELAGALRGHLDTLAGSAAVTTWWTQLAAFDRESGGAHGRLAGHFLADSKAFTVWHARQLRMASLPEERPWLRWWHVRAAETGEGEAIGAYAAYVAALLEEPAQAGAAETRWRATLGAPLPWPPRHAPPGVRVPRGEEGVTVHRSGHSTGDPRAVRMPEMPAMPSTPARPTRPVKPEKPQTPAPQRP
jgi:hypothetical protein